MSSFRFSENSTKRKEKRGVTKVTQKDNNSDKAQSENRRNFLTMVASGLALLASKKLFGEHNGSSEIKEEVAGDQVKIESLNVGQEQVIKLAFQYSKADDVKRELNNTLMGMENLDSMVLERMRAFELRYGHYFNKLPLGVGDLIYGLVIQESAGDKDNKSQDLETGENIAMGYTAMTEDMARAHKMVATNRDDDDRLKPERILPETVSELIKAHEYWGDWGMAIWEWHAGINNLNDIISIYLRDNFNGETQTSAGNFPKKLEQYELDAYKILSYRKIWDELQKPRWDKTGEFLYKVTAASLAFKNYKSQNMARGLTE